MAIVSEEYLGSIFIIFFESSRSLYIICHTLIKPNQSCQAAKGFKEKWPYLYQIFISGSNQVELEL